MLIYLLLIFQYFRADFYISNLYSNFPTFLSEETPLFSPFRELFSNVPYEELGFKTKYNKVLVTLHIS